MRRNSRNSRSSRSRRRGDEGGGLHAVGIGIFALTLLGCGILVYIWMTSKTPPILDSATLCPPEGPHSATVILLDSSDALPGVTRQELLTYLVDTAEAMPEHGLLEIRRLSQDAPGGSTVFSKCSPGTGDGDSVITTNPELRRKRWRERYLEPLKRELEAGLSPAESKTSPILATLQGIAVERFGGNRAAAMPKTLIVVSDLIEHGSDYSQYQGDLSYGRFQRSNAYKRVKTDLNGAEVNFRYVQRVTQKPINSAEHIKFWKDWVDDSNGRFKSAKKLQGAG
ncbi:hypothetical protein [Microvirga sp. VF16]|uniref:hypothetical protein n=1 Tax=Microvirga sp. VF16 TaxID=2807101 RepID=UPI00193C9CF4|nr:hypothetical protein [Microvirga sp. VF16]QRM35448.1 hypothetical protein JO965_44725 [Microvirga sp. VF16]